MFRPNPINGRPSGEKGGYTDADVTAHRFAVLESDLLPLNLQLAVIARLPLPITAIIFSGGKSYHALVRINAPDVRVGAQTVIDLGEADESSDVTDLQKAIEDQGINYVETSQKGITISG